MQIEKQKKLKSKAIKKVTSETQYPEMIRGPAPVGNRCLKARLGNTPKHTVREGIWSARAWLDVLRSLGTHSSLSQVAASVRHRKQALGHRCFCTWSTQPLHEKFQCVPLQGQPTSCHSPWQFGHRVAHAFSRRQHWMNTVGYSLQQDACNTMSFRKNLDFIFSPFPKL